MSKPLNRAAVFIDGSNTHAACKALNLDIDYRKLLGFFADNYSIVRAYYYTSILTEEDGYSGLMKLVDFLDFNGFTVVTKDAKEFVDSNGNTRVKGNMSVELTVDAMNIVHRVDEIIIMTGDGNYSYLVSALQRLGVRVTVVSTKATAPAFASEALRRQSDHFIDLIELRSLIDKLPPEPVKIARGMK